MGLNVLSLFDGMACGMVAFKQAGADVDNYYAYEIDKYAIQTATHNFPRIKECGDVFEADYSTYKGYDFVIGGSPCFVEGTLVLTDKGYKAIEDIQIGDKVLTHKGRYRNVTKVMCRETYGTVIVNAANSGCIECTAEHPFYTKDVITHKTVTGVQRVIDEKHCWTDPNHFHNIKDINGAVLQQTYLTTVTDTVYTPYKYKGCMQKVNKNHVKHIHTVNMDKYTHNTDFWYLVGAWLRVGSFTHTKRQGVRQYTGIRIPKVIGAIAVETLLKKLQIQFCCSAEYVYVLNTELALFLKQFGTGAHRKLMSGIYTLPEEIAKSFLYGYLNATASKVSYSVTNSKLLAYGLKYMINKYLQRACTVTKTVREVRHGKNRNSVTAYIVTYQQLTDYFIQENYMYAPYRYVSYIYEYRTVYNLAVAEDESYTANGLVVHNCTYWSIAQKNNREIEAQGLGWDLFQQYVRAIAEVKPKYFIYENNKSMSKAIRASITETFGFEPVCINSALVSAQNRQRLYWVGKLQSDGTYCKVNVAQPVDRQIYLRDIIAQVYGTAVECSTGDVLCVAQRGRDKGKGWEQQYEVNVTGKTNTLTKAQKDNLVVEPVNTVNGKAQTLKAQYAKNIAANFCGYSSTYGATGIAEPVCMRYERDEDAKRLRKQYEAHEIQHGFREHSVLQPRTDGKTNTLSTVLKDNPICEPVLILNATIDGKAKCLRATCYKDGLRNLVANDVDKRTCVAEKIGYAVPIVVENGVPIKAQSAADHKIYDILQVETGYITVKEKRYEINLPDGYYIIRKLTVNECKQLQTVPEWYDLTCVSTTQALKLLGNGWTVDVIVHLIKSCLLAVNEDD